MPRVATVGYREWVPVGIAGEKVSLAFPTLWGLPKIDHLVILLMLEKGDGRVDTEDSKYAGHVY